MARKSSFRRRTAEQGNAESIAVTEEQVVEVLTAGKIAEQGLLPYSSNHSFLVLATHAGTTLPAVYKPRRGESPLWDFEWGTLCQRETAAYQISANLQWNLVPPTILREGTHGIGSVQLYIPNDEQAHYFTVQEDARFAPTFRRLALFDYLVNNADRKSGHCLVGSDNRLWAIDHGLCFHVEYKLRTVIWEFSSEPIAPELLADLGKLAAQLADDNSELARNFCRLLSPGEREALHNRIGRLLKTRVYPAPQVHRRNYPWPPI